MKLIPILALFFIAIYARPTIVIPHDRVDKATVRFSIENAGFAVNGTIETVHAKIKFDPTTLQQSVIKATADAATIRTGISIRDKHLRRSDYFDVDKYPFIELVSTSFRKEGKNKFRGQFNVTIKCITKSVPIIFSRYTEGNTIRYHGSFTFNRLDFNLGEQSAILEETVRIELEAITYR